MRSFFIYSCVVFRVFDTYSTDEPDYVVYKVHSFEKDKSSSWFAEEEKRRSLKKTRDAVGKAKVDEYYYGQDSWVNQAPFDEEWYNECLSVEFVLPRLIKPYKSLAR